MINIQPTLIGKLVKLRPLKVEDLQGLYKAASDQKIWEQHPDRKRYQRQHFTQKFFKPAIACKGALAFQNTNNEIIGSSRYYDYRPDTKDISIGYTFITRPYWGSTYNREIKHLMMSHIYQYVDTIYFSVGENNTRSRKAMGKIGGQLLPHSQVLKRTIPVNQSVIFEIKKQDFKGLI